MSFTASLKSLFAKSNIWAHSVSHDCFFSLNVDHIFLFLFMSYCFLQHLYILFSGITIAVVAPMLKSSYLSGEKRCLLELVDHITEIQETPNVCWVFSLPRLSSRYGFCDFCDSLCVLEWYILFYHYLSILDLHNVLIWKWRQIYSACLGPFQWMSDVHSFFIHPFTHYFQTSFLIRAMWRCLFTK